MIQVGPDFKRIDTELIFQYKKIGTATLGHILEKEISSPFIRPIYKNLKLVGSAFTVQTKGKDISAITEAYKLAQSGDVLVVNSEEYKGKSYACAGEMSTYKSIEQGISGLVVDGGVTDYLDMENIGFPCFSRYVTPLVGRRENNKGGVRVSVNIGGVAVEPGDLVLGDDDGLIFLKPAQAKSLLPDMLEKEKKEQQLRKEFKIKRHNLRI